MVETTVTVETIVTAVTAVAVETTVTAVTTVTVETAVTTVTVETVDTTVTVETSDSRDYKILLYYQLLQSLYIHYILVLATPSHYQYKVQVVYTVISKPQNPQYINPQVIFTTKFLYTNE